MSSLHTTFRMAMLSFEDVVSASLSRADSQNRPVPDGRDSRRTENVAVGKAKVRVPSNLLLFWHG